MFYRGLIVASLETLDLNRGEAMKAMIDLVSNFRKVNFKIFSLNPTYLTF